MPPASPTVRPELSLTVQGTHAGGPDLILAVEVKDAGGVPVTGLTTKNFKVFQLGQFLGELNLDIAVDLAGISELKGMYHLVRKLWAPAVNGTFAFKVRATNGRATGTAMGWVVKVEGRSI